MFFLYYCQGWNLALNGKPLFDEDFIGGVFGPNIIELYEYLKEWDFQLISYRNNITIKLPLDEIYLSEDFIKHIDEIFDVYGQYTTSNLTEAIRCQYPYINSRKGLSKAERGKNIILKEDIRKYFSEQLEKPNFYLVKEKFFEFWNVLMKYLGVK